MSAVTDEESPVPKFWLAFRTFDDGLSSQAQATVRPSHANFPQFARLPPELRIKIWSCLVQPRIITGCCLPRGERSAERQGELLSRTHGSGTPVLLHINREARHVGLGHYELAFAYKIHEHLAGLFLSRPPRVWFNFALDALYLTGELEAFDMYGFNSPMVYFLQREDAKRVRHVACAFADVGSPEMQTDQVFGCLWHIVDRFSAAKRLLLTVTGRDEERKRGLLLSPDNVMQTIWNGWMSGVTITTSRMANKQILLVKEEELADIIAT